MRAVMVCPQCEAPAKVSVQVVTNDMPPFERYECDSCGRQMLSIDLVPKYGMNIARGHVQPRGAGGGATRTPGGFPHFWLEYGTNGAGLPVMPSPGVFDATLIAKMARWDMVTLNVHPFTDTAAPANLAIISLLKAQNPALKIIWYDTIQQRFLFVAPGTQWGDEWSLVIGPPALRFYFDSGHGGDEYPDHLSTTAFWDMANSGTALANIWKSYTQGEADGYLFDYFIGNPGTWATGIDFALAGYGSIAALNTANRTGLDTFTAAMQGTGLMYGNRGASANLTPDSIIQRCTGETVEDWDPDQGLGGAQIPGGGTGSGLFASFDAAMNFCFVWQGSSPTGDGTVLLKAETGNSSPSANVLAKLIRYTLGSACVAGGSAYIGNNRDGTNDPNFWADEYSVDALGVSDGTGQLANKGWLGRPTEFGYKDAGSSLYVRHFERGVVVLNGTTSTHSIDLGKVYRRLRGVYDPSVNNGATVQNLSVPSKDARFLLA